MATCHKFYYSISHTSNEFIPITAPDRNFFVTGRMVISVQGHQEYRATTQDRDELVPR